MNTRRKLQIVLLSGRISAGKTRLAAGLVDRHGATLVKTRELILRTLPRTRDKRQDLQRAGERLDRQTEGRWLAEALAALIDERRLNDELPEGLFVLDAVRINGQIEAIRRAFGDSVAHHVHLTASSETLENRFSQRKVRSDDGVTWSQAAANATERKVEGLAAFADTVINTDHCTPNDVSVRATALLGLIPRSVDQLVDVLVGGQFGSEGKGNIVGHIAPEYDLFVRVGGPNAGHQVYAVPMPEKYFHLPSGSERAPNAQLLLGPGAVIHPGKLLAEINTHKISADRLVIDEHAMIIEDVDREVEKAKLASMGSTAQGVGAASARKIMGRGGAENPPVRLAKDVPDLKPYIGQAQRVLDEAYCRGQRILLEGTQGTSLSLHHGPYPHVTSRDTTVSGCLADAGIAPGRVRRTIAVFRTYPIRVGGPSGDFGGAEITHEDIALRSGIPVEELKSREVTTTTGRSRRFGEFDWVQLHRSCVLNGPTDIALTFVDYLSVRNRDAYRFEQLTEETLRFIEEVERVSGQPVTLISTKFDWRNVIDRRSW
ncbi:adenylosuccinate synthase [Mesorhizobium sp. B2-4-13]|uniref:adenylosuccinate synthetase n=1 Tax=Mesorhizobium sp. B2-4-13 TaxID=2589936 RepID=UPI001150C817|nr:adenylosuccinate synthetase [Mesorhizobium sp. B2-4-13]TPK80200.1 adenylosuccinate synthase [Mesorhizobium sp. B2-4-13]